MYTKSFSVFQTKVSIYLYPKAVEIPGCSTEQTKYSCLRQEKVIVEG